MPEDIVLTILRALQTDVAAIKRDLAVLHQDVRMIRSAVNDIARVHVSTGEVEALHSDVNSLLDRMVQVEARLDTLETDS